MSKLFVPGDIGTMRLKNRMIMTAIHTGFSMEREIAFLEERAKGGAAAVTAVLGVSPGGAFSNMNVIDQDSFSMLSQMADTIKSYGAQLIVQLFHVGRNCRKGYLADPELTPVAPSSLPSPIYRDEPKALTVEEIHEIVRKFGEAAMLCKKAGVSAVEISASAGYLLSAFLSPLTNLRRDEYGGSFEKRIRFPKEVTAQVRKQVGKGYPVLMRISAEDMLGGYDVKESCAFIQEVKLFIDAVNVTGGWHESPVPQISMYLPEGGFAHLAKEIRKNVNLPIIACNRINCRETAEGVLENECADFVGSARGFLIDSGYVNKMQEGKPHRKCIACNRGCIEPVLKMQEVGCIFNPKVGKEGERLKRDKTGKVLVIGGGPAGMQAALCLAEQGYSVRLCEKENLLGGQMRLAAEIPHKEAFRENIRAMEQELFEAGVEIVKNCAVNATYIEGFSPVFIAVATGSKPLLPAIKGIALPHVHTAGEVLLSKHKIRGGIVAVIGGGAVGIETALFLARKNANLKIIILEMQSKAGTDLSGLRRSVMQEISKLGIEILTDTRLLEVREREILCQQSEGEAFIKADHIILAIGSVPERTLADEIAEEGQREFVIIGDANEIGNIGTATKASCEVIQYPHGLPNPS